MERYMDTKLSPEERAKDLLEKLSLDEKMAQVTGVFAVPGKEEQMAAFVKHGIGQISTLEFRTCKSVEEAAAWQKKLQNIVLNSSEHHIPAVFHMEGLSGAFIQDATSFPSGVNRGSAFDPELEKKIGEIVARQELGFGITQILAPVLDISRDSRMGRQCEPYGEDPTLAAAMGSAYTKGIQGTEVDGRKADALAKHFLAFHNSQGGIHGANVDAGDRLLDEIYGKPFQAAIAEAKLKGIMPCYGSISGRPIHASKKYLTDLLREEMGFDGVVASDYSAVENIYNVQKVGESKADAGYLAMKAGMDVELPMPSCYHEELKAKFASGEADMEVLNRAVLRVLTAKFRMGLFEHPFSLEGSLLLQNMHHAEDDEVSRQAAQESLILLKNDGALPLSGKEKTIAVIGPHAENARFYFGGYTHLSMVEAIHAAANSMAGIGEGGETRSIQMERVPGTNIQVDETEEFDQILRQLHPECKNLVEVLREELPETEVLSAAGYPKAGADTSGFAEALVLVKQADVVLLTLGGKNGSGSIATMGEGVDGTNINLPECQDAFIRECKKLGKPMIGIHFDGRPISSDTADELLDAIIEAWTPAEFAAEAVVNVLTGTYNPSGKLPLTVARNAGQIPIYYNHPNGSAWHQGESIGFQDYADLPHTPRYHFGHGLSYTTFTYSDLELSKKEVSPDEETDISLTVHNTGNTAGTEVVQLYLKDVHASMTRPVMELQGFARVALDAGEAKRVTFRVSPSQTAFLDEEMKWKIEKGEIRVLVGSSSADIRLEDQFSIREDQWIEGRERSFYAGVNVNMIHA
ncbi:MAG: glycoside hydrolase family 3 C-terminal domain-containing protein [Blautia sp.]|nr:glycoside hydrolase family 3 C-terminal domain-containing protein [Blautia sp.]